jgi:hypothetical protein
MRRTVGILVACLAMALVLGGCGKHNLARNRECPKGWACYAPAQLPISEYCTHLLRRWEQVAERETQAGERVRPMLEGLIRQTMTMDAAATRTVQANRWHERSEVIETAVSQLALRRVALVGLRHEIAGEQVAPSIALGRLVTLAAGSGPWC